MNRILPFFKVVGAGNDCLVAHASDLDAVSGERNLIIRSICDRQNGVGADQFFEVLRLSPLAVQVWNCDGSKAEMCANGTRSFLLLAREQGWLQGELESLSLEVSGKTYSATWTGNGYELCLGVPTVAASRSLKLSEKTIPYYPVSVGNPHAVIFADEANLVWIDPKDFHFKDWGAQIEAHPDFPNRTNVEFIRSIKMIGESASIRAEVWERGAGATLSCGTGAVAIAAAMAAGNPSLKSFTVHMNQYALVVRLDGGFAYLSGPSRTVAKGSYIFLA